MEVIAVLDDRRHQPVLERAAVSAGLGAAAVHVNVVQEIAEAAGAVAPEFTDPAGAGLIAAQSVGILLLVQRRADLLQRNRAVRIVLIVLGRQRHAVDFRARLADGKAAGLVREGHVNRLGDIWIHRHVQARGSNRRVHDFLRHIAARRGIPYRRGVRRFSADLDDIAAGLGERHCKRAFLGNGGLHRVDRAAGRVVNLDGRALRNRAVRTLYGEGSFLILDRLPRRILKIGIQIRPVRGIAIEERPDIGVSCAFHAQAVGRGIVDVVAHAARFNAPQLRDVRAVGSFRSGKARRAVGIVRLVRAQEHVVQRDRAVLIGVAHAQTRLVQAGSVLRGGVIAVCVNQRKRRRPRGGLLEAAHAALAVHIAVNHMRGRGGGHLARHAQAIVFGRDLGLAAADTRNRAVLVHDRNQLIRGRPLPRNTLRVAAADLGRRRSQRNPGIRLGKHNAVLGGIERFVICGKAVHADCIPAGRARGNDDVIALAGLAVRRQHGRPRNQRRLETAAVVEAQIGRSVVDIGRRAPGERGYAAIVRNALHQLERFNRRAVFRAQPQAIEALLAILDAQDTVLAQHGLLRIRAL